MSKTAPLRQPGKLLEQDIAGMAYGVYRKQLFLETGRREPKWRDIDPQMFAYWCEAVATARRGQPIYSGIVSALVGVLHPFLH